MYLHVHTTMIKIMFGTFSHNFMEHLNFLQIKIYTNSNLFYLRKRKSNIYHLNLLLIEIASTF